ncbi:MAG: dehydrogenase, short-chain alcohol dehydrogenase like [Acidimicrobiales bacterium]|nr:dehydrogenase, short-chain alcohol dehydrogenase like [Acidimicrobiales bacterium]
MSRHPHDEHHPARFAEIVDRVLEAPVVPSFTRVGYDVRSRLFAWAPLDGYDLRGRTIVLTGPTSGLGLAAAHQLARCGARLVLVGRDRERTELTRAELPPAKGDRNHTVVVADLSDLMAVRAAAAEIVATTDAVHALVHNAGALTALRRETADGTEATVASQVVGPFLLTLLLLDRLRAAAPGRVITVSSGGMYTERVSVDRLEMGEDYRGSVQYARAKRAQVTLNEVWAGRVSGSDVVFHAMHPGWADTPGVAAALPRFRRVLGPLLRPPAQGADTIAWLASDDGEPATTTGTFWLDRHARAIHKLGSTRRSDSPAERARLWDWCVTRSGIGQGGQLQVAAPLEEPDGQSDDLSRRASRSGDQRPAGR